MEFLIILSITNKAVSALWIVQVFCCPILILSLTKFEIKNPNFSSSKIIIWLCITRLCCAKNKII